MALPRPPEQEGSGSRWGEGDGGRSFQQPLGRWPVLPCGSLVLRVAPRPPRRGQLCLPATLLCPASSWFPCWPPGCRGRTRACCPGRGGGGGLPSVLGGGPRSQVGRGAGQEMSLVGGEQRATADAALSPSKPEGPARLVPTHLVALALAPCFPVPLTPGPRPPRLRSLGGDPGGVPRWEWDSGHTAS